MSKYVNSKFVFGIVLFAAVLIATAVFSLGASFESPTFRFNKPALPKPVAPKITTLFFAGDIMLSRNVGTKIVEANDTARPYANTSSVISSANISFANLESPFYDKGPRLTQGLIFKAEPNTVEGLVQSGFDILSTANNHSFDQGRGGVDYTLNWLATYGIAAVGTGLDCHNGKILTSNGIKFGYLAYSYTAYNDGGKIKDPLVCDWNDLAQIKKDIELLKPKVDFLIVSSHMGTEYKRQPDEANELGAKETIDAGADLFVGHHPHWFQTIEQYNGKWIFYSLGNFVFDQMWSQETKEGLTFVATFEDKELKQIELKPVIIEDFCCPRWTNSTETLKILNKINLTSTHLMNKN